MPTVSPGSEVLADSLFSGISAIQASALAFGLLLVAVLIGIMIFYQVMWASKSRPEGGGAARLLRNIVTAAAGWGVAALLATSYLSFTTDQPATSLGQFGAGFVDVLGSTVTVLMTFVGPWLAAGLPLFLT